MSVPPAIPHAVYAASIGIPDTMLLMLLALIVFGPRRLPEIGRQIGKLMYEFRKISNDFKFQMEEELRVSEEMERQRQLSVATAQAPHTPPPAPDFTTPDLAAPDLDNPGLTASEPPTTHAYPATIAPESAVSADAVAADAPAYPAASVEAAAPSFPSIQPPRQGGVVPRAFRGLVPQPAIPADPVLNESSTPLAPVPESTRETEPGQETEHPGQTTEHPQAAEQHG